MKKIYQQINSKNWCQDAYAKDKDGHAVTTRSVNAVRWCAVGWIIRIYPTKNCDRIQQQLRDVLNMPPSEGLGKWNDTRHRTWQQVRAAFKKAGL